MDRLPPVPGDAVWRTTGPDTRFDVTHDRVLNPIQRGKWRLQGAANVRFAGRIDPHENSELMLVGPGVTALEGRFSELRLPDGWRGELVHDTRAGTVMLKNLRPDRAPAFPGAEGFGKYTIGGRGGKVFEVTNLTDSGPGSLREACEAEGPRTVVFRLSGTIELKSELEIEHPFITIAGQTAPGDGICLKNYQFSFDTQHLIVRYLRVRPGDEMREEQDALGGSGDHIIIDHCSVSWGVDETLSINKASNLTVQWCMVTESLTKSLHKKGAHGYGGLWGGPGGSFHHNILAHHSSRNPRPPATRTPACWTFETTSSTTGDSTAPMAARCGRGTGSITTSNTVPRRPSAFGIASFSKRTPEVSCIVTAISFGAFPASQAKTGPAASTMPLTARPTKRRSACTRLSRRLL